MALRNSDIKHKLIEIRLFLLTIDRKFQAKYPSGKMFYWISADSEQKSYISKTVEKDSSTATLLTSQLVCETPIIQSEKIPTYNFLLEEKVNLLKIEIIAI